MAVYKDKERGTWMTKFRYRDWQGRVRSTTKRGFKTKRDAANYEHDFKEGASQRSDISIRVLIMKYLEDKRLHVKETTYRATEIILRTKFLPYFGELKLTELTPLVMRNWQNEMLKLGLKQGTLMQINRICSSLMNYAVRFYGLPENPIRKAGSIGHSESSQTFWEIDEFKKFIAVVENPMYKLCFNLLFYSGMRVGELLALDVSDFDFNKNLIHVTKNIPMVTGKLTTPKTPSSIRDIEMPRKIMKQAANYIESLNAVTSPLFKISSNGLRFAFERDSKKAGVKVIRMHDLRHSHASYLIANGFSIASISRRLGHKSPKITLEVYSHMYKESGAQIAEFMDADIN